MGETAKNQTPQSQEDIAKDFCRQLRTFYKIDPTPFTPRQIAILFHIEKNIPTISVRIDKILGDNVVDFVDLVIFLQWYAWGLARNKRKIDDLLTPDDCIKRFTNFCLRKMESLIAFKEKAAERETKLAALRNKLKAKKKLHVVK